MIDATQSERYYGLSEWDRLEDEVENVVDRVLEENCCHAGEEFDVIADRMEWPMTVLVFRRMDHTSHAQRLADNALDDMVSDLDSEFGDSEGDVTEPTEAMRKAAKAFADAVCAEYEAFQCDPTGETVMVTREQAREMFE
jgi:hypothetical protein